MSQGIKDMDLIKVETINNKEVLLYNPIIVSNNTMEMLLLSTNISNINIRYENDKKRVVLEDYSKKKWCLKISKEDLDFLEKLFKEKFNKAEKYYNNLKKNKVNFLLFENGSDGIITTKELIDNNYESYFMKLTEFYLENKKKTSLEKLLEKALKEKDKLEKVDNEYGVHYIVTI